VNRYKIGFIAVFLCVPFLFTNCANKITFVTIGTGGITGVYYPTGGAISRMLNRKTEQYQIKATVESTAGSVYNINAVMRGNLDFGIAQSDRQHQAYAGLAEWDELGPQTDLRSVFSIHPESITLVASIGSRIRTLKDLKGKRVNIGNPGSGQLQNTKDILWAFGISHQLDLKDEQVKAIEAPGLLQDGRLDAFFYTVGHPNGNIKEATSGRVKVRFIPIEGRQLDYFLRAHPYYSKSVIPIKYYPNALNKKDVNTVGVKATLITSKKVKAEIVYVLTKEVFENLETFKALHESFANLTPKNMLEGLSAPVHIGALKYFKEVDLLRYIDQRLLPTEWKK